MDINQGYSNGYKRANLVTTDIRREYLKKRISELRAQGRMQKTVERSILNMLDDSFTYGAQSLGDFHVLWCLAEQEIRGEKVQLPKWTCFPPNENNCTAVNVIRTTLLPIFVGALLEQNEAVTGKGFFSAKSGNLDRQELLLEYLMDDFFKGISDALKRERGTVGLYSYLIKIVMKRSINYSYSDFYVNPLGITLRASDSYLKHTDSDSRQTNKSMAEIDKISKICKARGVDFISLSIDEKIRLIREMAGNKLGSTDKSIKEKIFLFQARQAPIPIDTLYRRSEKERSMDLYGSSSVVEMSGNEEVLDNSNRWNEWGAQASLAYVEDHAGDVVDSMLIRQLWDVVNKYLSEYNDIESEILTKFITEVSRDNANYFNRKAVSIAIGKYLRSQGRAKTHLIDNTIRKFQRQMTREALIEGSIIQQMLKQIGIEIKAQ